MNDFPSPSQEKFLSRRQRSQPIVLPEEFSDEEMARDWTLSAPDRATLLECIQKRYRPWSGIQLCAARLYGRFLSDCNELSPRLVNYINQQLELPPCCRFPCQCVARHDGNIRRCCSATSGFGHSMTPRRQRLRIGWTNRRDKGPFPPRYSTALNAVC